MSSRLSPRESEILRGICEGRSTKEISVLLDIAESTVNWHISNTLKKLGAASRAEAVFKAYRAGMLDDAPVLIATAARPREPARRSAPPNPLLMRARRVTSVAARFAVAAALVFGVMAAATEASRGAPLFRLGPILPVPALSGP